MYVQAATKALSIDRGSTCDLLGLDDDAAFWAELQDAAHMDVQINMDLAWESGEVGLALMELFREAA